MIEGAGTNQEVTGNLVVDERLTFTAPGGNYINLNGTTGIAGPILYVSQGMLGQDITAYGFLGSQTDPAKQAGGGAILLGSGFTSPCTPPIISLSDSFLDMQIANGSMPQARYMRDVVYRQDQGAFYIWNGSIWVCFRGPFSYLPQGSTLVTDQFFTATDTQTIYVNDPEAQWVPLGPWTGSNFQGFDTLFLLTSDYSLLANLSRDGLRNQP